MKKTFTLPVSCNVEGCDDYAFVIEIDEKLARLLLDRIDRLKKWKEEDHSVYEVYFFEWMGQFHIRDYESEELDGENPVAGEPARTECEQTIVREDGVLFFAYPKHGDAHLTSEEISVGELREIAGEPAEVR